MGVVRREGDWRLEKREPGVYEITYQKEVQLKVLTSDARSGIKTDAILDVAPTREVGSYSEAEGLFEEKAHGRPPVGMQNGSGDGLLDQPSSGETAMNFSDGLEGELEDVDLPPGGFAVVFLIVGGAILSTSGFSPNAPMFLVGIGFVTGGFVIAGWAGILYRKDGRSRAIEFLMRTENSGGDKSTGSEKTPPAPEKLKNTLIFDRANQRCEWCEKQFDHPHVHHIEPRREGGPNDPDNLIVLCPNCHEKADRNAIPRSKLKAKVKRLPPVPSE